MPFQPRSIDVWALDDMQALLAEARAVRDVDARAVLVMSDARGTDNATAAAAVPDGLVYLDAPIGRRKLIAELAGQGMSPLEVPSRDPKAFAELQALLTAVFG